MVVFSIPVFLPPKRVSFFGGGGEGGEGGGGRGEPSRESVFQIERDYIFCTTMKLNQITIRLKNNTPASVKILTHKIRLLVSLSKPVLLNLLTPIGKIMVKLGNRIVVNNYF